jgi:hypothetical protein
VAAAMIYFIADLIALCVFEPLQDFIQLKQVVVFIIRRERVATGLDFNSDHIANFAVGVDSSAASITMILNHELLSCCESHADRRLNA